MKPLAGNVLIVPAASLEDEEQQVAFAGAHVGVASGAKLQSGLHLPSSTQQVQSKPSEGIVRAIGQEVTLEIKEGDRVLYRTWTGLEVRINGVDHQLTPQRDVLAIVDEGEKVEVVLRPIAAPQPQKRPVGF